MALEKPTRGKPVRERESLLLASGKNQTLIFTVKNPTYLNPEICLGFRAIFFSKNVPKPAATQP